MNEYSIKMKINESNFTIDEKMYKKNLKRERSSEKLKSCKERTYYWKNQRNKNVTSITMKKIICRREAILLLTYCFSYRWPFLFAISTNHDRIQKHHKTLSHSKQKRNEKKSTNSVRERKIERIEYEQRCWNLWTKWKKDFKKRRFEKRKTQQTKRCTKIIKKKIVRKVEELQRENMLMKESKKQERHIYKDEKDYL